MEKQHQLQPVRCRTPAAERTWIRGTYTITPHSQMESLKGSSYDNLNSLCHYNRMGLSLAPVHWKDIPGLFCLEKWRGALCMSFRKDCRAETWRRSTLKSRGDGSAFPHTLSVGHHFLGPDTFYILYVHPTLWGREFLSFHLRKMVLLTHAF